MAIAFDAAISAKATAASSLSFSHTCTGTERFLFVGAGNSSGDLPANASVTYATIALTRPWAIQAQSFYRNSGHYLVNPASGANTVAVTWENIEDELAAGAISFTGVDQTTPVGTSATANGASGVPTVDVSSESGGIVVDNIYGNGSTATPTAGTGQTRRWGELVAAGAAGAGSTEAGAATVTMSWADADWGEWIVGALPIKAAAAGGTVIPVLTRQYRERWAA